MYFHATVTFGGELRMPAEIKKELASMYPVPSEKAIAEAKAIYKAAPASRVTLT
jgi:hypothetical protein